MRQAAGWIVAAVFLVSTILVFVTSSGVAARTGEEGSTYADLEALFESSRKLNEPPLVDGIPDYSEAAMARQYEELRGFQRQLEELDIAAWPITQQIDYHLVRAELNGIEFMHRVLKPWTKDPYLYWGSSTSTSMPYYGFSDRPAVPEGPGWGESGYAGEPDYPLSEQEQEAYRTRLSALPKILAQGKANIVIPEAKRDMALMALRSLAVEGGLLEGMVVSMKEHHPELAPAAQAAWEAIEDYRDWILKNIDDMAAPTGVGTENLSRWLKNVWLIPYTYEEIRTIAKREFERGLTALKLEEYRNRDLPRLTPAQGREEYIRRHRAAEDKLRAFLLDGELMTVTADEIEAAYAAYPPRPPATPSEQPNNFLGAIIHEHLGHQLDALRPETGMSKIRASRRLHEMTHARREGVADGLIEMLMHAGILDDQPRMRELVDIGIANRASIAIAALEFQANAVDYEGWNRLEHKMSIYGSLELDESEWYNAAANYNRWDHKKDAVRAPGYEIAYLTGVVQFNQLFADRAEQLGADFDVREFMDEFFAVGQIPTALIRWQMTGLTDEMETLLGVPVASPPPPSD